MRFRAADLVRPAMTPPREPDPASPRSPTPEMGSLPGVARPGQGTAGRGAGQIFIRPESIRFGPGENALRGRVIRRTFLGATTDFLVEVGGRQLRIIASSDATDLPGGEEVVVSVRPDRCLFLAS